MPLNEVVGLESDLFVGQLVWMARPTHSKLLESEDYKYKWHFAKKTRTWEIRMQGKFTSVPSGRLYAGIVLADFDYSRPPDLSMRSMMRIIVPILEAAVKQKCHLSWGDRGEHANRPDAELLCLVASMAGIDQMVVTPKGETPPPIDSAIESYGIRRNAMKKAAWEEKVADVMANLNTEDTYTFCLWGLARFMDLFSWWAAPTNSMSPSLLT